MGWTQGYAASRQGRASARPLIYDFIFCMTIILSIRTITGKEADMRHAFCTAVLCTVILVISGCSRSEYPRTKETGREALAQEFGNPPRKAGIRCWWWWLNGNVTQASITKDLEAMAAKGFSGAMIFDAGTELRWGPDEPVPAGPVFAGPNWTELFLHALQEARRLGLELGLSIQSGWNLGGPSVTPDDAAKQLTWSSLEISGPGPVEKILPVPEHRDGYYREIALLAFPGRDGKDGRPIRNLAAKSAARELGGSAPDCRFLLDDYSPVPGEAKIRLKDIQDISGALDSKGRLSWQAPPGTWTVMRFGYTLTKARVATSSDTWKGRVIDYLSEDAFMHYWERVVDPLLQQAGPLAGTVLQHLETDSWECGGMNWSPGFRDDFTQYRGYDPLPWLPVIAGTIVGNREMSNAFLADLRKTIGECVSDNHYRVFAERAAAYHLGIQPESGGPHAGPIDGITNYSHSSVVMSEFWIPCPHRPAPESRFFVKQAASAAHIYGKQLVGAESFTSLRNPHWSPLLWRDLKPAMDHEFCSGLNLIFLHTFTASPADMGLPGQEYFAGTHINPQVTWWNYADPFFDYMARVQLLAQQGRFQADVLYYYGDHVPNIAALKESDPAGALPGYDYDVTNEDVLLRLSVHNGRITVPGGVRYRLLVLPDHRVLSLAALEKTAALLKEGATVLGPKPERLVSLQGGQKAQERFQQLADRLWGASPPEKGSARAGKGRLAWGVTAREFLRQEGIPADFETGGGSDAHRVDYIHYRAGEADLYFLANQTEHSLAITGLFRTENAGAEIWDPLTGDITPVPSRTAAPGRTAVQLTLDPCGSCFVVFSETASGTGDRDKTLIQEIPGPWNVAFDAARGGPQSVRFDTLSDWTLHENPGIRYYSGAALYTTDFTVDSLQAGHRYWLELTDVQDAGIAQVTLNGSDQDTVWTPPFRVEVTNSLVSGRNTLEIRVVNNWLNRLIGDRGRPQEKRYTRTNIRIREDWSLQPSGLIGPVRVYRSR